MKVVIVETVHAQYGLTQSELFHCTDKVFFTTKPVHEQMHALAPGLCDGLFLPIRDVGEACEGVLQLCGREHVDLISFSPVFSDLEHVLRVAMEVTATTAITIHNLNYWFNARFRTWKYYKQRRLKQQIVEAFDHILIDEGMYAYLKNERPNLLHEHSFLVVPFTLFHERGASHFERRAHEKGRLKVVLPGSIYWGSRDYRPVLEVIERFAGEHAPVTFSFAGPAKGGRSMDVVQRLDRINKQYPGIATYYPTREPATTEMFLQEMETADLLLSPLNAVFDALGTREYYGKTKVTGAMGDLITFQLPGVLPSYIPVPRGLMGSVFHYTTAAELYDRIRRFLDEPKVLAAAKARAASNAYGYTAEAVRNGLGPLLATRE